MTGRYQTRFGHELNLIGRQNMAPDAGLPLSETTLATRLQEAGYRTAAVGKWHLGASPKYHPQSRGFDEFFGFLHEGHFYAPAGGEPVASRLRTNEPPYDDANPLMRGRLPVEEPEYLTRALAREAVSFLQRNRRRPFFLYLPFNAVHSPMQAAHQDLDRYARIPDMHRRMFAAMLGALDEAVGRVLENLDSNTLVVFLSDNGGPIQELTSGNGALRGQKGQLYEGGIRVPFLMEWKSRIRGGQTIGDPVISCDLFPTLLSAAGVRHRGQPLDGVDLLPRLTGRTRGAPHAALFWRYGRSKALRSGDWKIVQQRPRGADAETPWQLFNLRADAGETTDLAAVHAGRAKSMSATWEALNGEMVPPLWGRV